MAYHITCQACKKIYIPGIQKASDVPSGEHLLRRLNHIVPHLNHCTASQQRYLLLGKRGFHNYCEGDGISRQCCLYNSKLFNIKLPEAE